MMEAPIRYARITKTRRELVARFPMAFVKKHKPKQPLKLSILDDLLARAPDLDKSDLIGFFRYYTLRPTYLKATVVGALRVDLDGNCAGLVTEGQARWAAGRLEALQCRLNQMLIEKEGIAA